MSVLLLSTAIFSVAAQIVVSTILGPLSSSKKIRTLDLLLFPRVVARSRSMRLLKIVSVDIRISLCGKVSFEIFSFSINSGALVIVFIGIYWGLPFN